MTMTYKYSLSIGAESKQKDEIYNQHLIHFY